MRTWRIVIAALACLGPALQYVLMVYDETLASGSVKSVEFFSYFTILSNILAAVVLTAPLVAPTSVVGLWAERSSTRISVAVYLTITAAIYHTLLAGLWDPRGLRLVSDILLHTITPTLFLVDWLIRGGQGETGRATAAKALHDWLLDMERQRYARAPRSVPRSAPQSAPNSAPDTPGLPALRRQWRALDWPRNPQPRPQAAAAGPTTSTP